MAGRRPYRWWHETVLLALVIGLLAYARVTEPVFVTWETQLGLSTHALELGLLALAMTPIIITAGIDLSVGATMALCAVVLGLSYEAGLNPWIGALLALGTGLLAGALNGYFVTRFRVHPLIVTLATLAAYRGMAEGISLGRPVSGFPPSFTWLSTGSVWSLLTAALLFVLAAAAMHLGLSRTPAGRYVYAMGHNETACRFSGVPVDRVKGWLYAYAGSTAAITAVLFVSRRNTAKADVGLGLDLDVITAVVLGGTSIYGGRGHIFGTVLGVLLIHQTREFVSWRWNRDELNFVVIGLLLIVSVLLHRALASERRRKKPCSAESES